MELIRVVIAEDHRIVREGLISCLQNRHNILVVGEASNGKEAVEISLQLQPDVILMDIGMPEMNGFEATKILSKELPSGKVLILTAHDEEEYILELLKSGARGYVLKDISSDELIKAIEVVYLGETYFGSEVTKIVVREYVENIIPTIKDQASILTEREREILRLLAEGYVNKEIAVILNLSVKTINSHRESIMRKVDIHTIAGLTKYAIENKIIMLSKPVS
jgi:two-component system, NarL family, nitrate/nitrite response regulator NarL